MLIKGFSCFSSGSHFVQWSNHFSNVGRESFKEHFYEIILKLGHWPTIKMSLKGFSIFSSGDHFVEPSTTILAYLVESHPRNISMKLFENWSTGLGADII